MAHIAVTLPSDALCNSSSSHNGYFGAMEGAAVFGLACNVLQITILSKDLILMTRQIRASVDGFSAGNEELRRSADHLRRVAEEASAQDDKTLGILTQNCQRTIGELLAMLETLRLKSSDSKFRAFLMAIRTMFKQKDLDALQLKIDRHGKDIATYLTTKWVPQTGMDVQQILEQQSDFSQRWTGDMVALKKMLKEIHGMAKNGTGGVDSVKDTFQKLQEWVVKQDRQQNDVQCLQALYFKDWKTREEEVQDAHWKTFQWILAEVHDTDDGQTPYEDKFSKWLQSHKPEENVFWITGKPGSGKSTLMKFLAGHKRLQPRLQGWIGDRKLIVSEYFFWRPGSPLQRSRLGLLQSILFQILKADRELINIAFPAQDWTVAGSKFEFTQGPLLQGLKNILERGPQARKVCFFFFIDGLDELDERDEKNEHIENEQELIEVLRLFYNSPAVKLCTSSRPWPKFRKEFEQDVERCFWLDDMTRGDISVYIQEKLVQDPAFQRLVEEDNSHLNLVHEIIVSAEGVFLWVQLVVRSLLDGITNTDTIAQLQYRLRQLPRKLEDLYQHILGSIDRHYRKDVARHLLYAINGGRHTGSFSMLLVFHYCLDEHNCSNLLDRESLDEHELFKDMINTRRRIDGQCGGLLRPSPLDESVFSRPSCYPLSRRLQEIFRPTVTVAHRTVSDFLRDIYGIERLRKLANFHDDVVLSEYEFRANMAVLNAIICLNHDDDQFDCCRLDRTRSYYKSVEAIVTACFLHAENSGKGTKDERWGAIVGILCRNRHGPAREAMNTMLRAKETIHHPGLLLAFSIDLLGLWKSIVESLSAPLEAYMTPAAALFLAMQTGRQRITDPLLKHGADLNEYYSERKTSYWKVLLQDWCCEGLRHHDHMRARIRALLEGGADPRAVCEVHVVNQEVDGKTSIYFLQGYRAIAEGQTVCETVEIPAGDVIRHVTQVIDFYWNDYFGPRTTDLDTREQIMARWGIDPEMHPSFYHAGKVPHRP